MLTVHLRASGVTFPLEDELARVGEETVFLRRLVRGEREEDKRKGRMLRSAYFRSAARASKARTVSSLIWAKSS